MGLSTSRDSTVPIYWEIRKIRIEDHGTRGPDYVNHWLNSCEAKFTKVNSWNHLKEETRSVLSFSHKKAGRTPARYTSASILGIGALVPAVFDGFPIRRAMLASDYFNCYLPFHPPPSTGALISLDYPQPSINQHRLILPLVLLKHLHLAIKCGSASLD